MNDGTSQHLHVLPKTSGDRERPLNANIRPQKENVSTSIVLFFNFVDFNRNGTSSKVARRITG
jgi:hypothetical protein